MSVLPTDLLGSWGLSRQVHDRLSGEHREVAGQAALDLTGPDRVRWHEAGTMRWDGHEVPVSRTLYVVRVDAAGTWLVHFEDGRVFHPWAIGVEVEHPCTPDHYRGLLEVEGDPIQRWTVRWSARGPHKDYTMTTEHLRLDA